MHTDYCRCFLYFHIYIVLHECVIAFSILYIFRLCDYGCRDDDFFVNAGRACIEDQSMYALQPLECICGLILHTGSVGVE